MPKSPCLRSILQIEGSVARTAMPSDSIAGPDDHGRVCGPTTTASTNDRTRNMEEIVGMDGIGRQGIGDKIGNEAATQGPSRCRQQDTERRAMRGRVNARCSWFCQAGGIAGKIDGFPAWVATVYSDEFVGFGECHGGDLIHIVIPIGGEAADKAGVRLRDGEFRISLIGTAGVRRGDRV